MIGTLIKLRKISASIAVLHLKSLILFFETQDFCKTTNWPPIKELKFTKGKDGKSCVFACLDEGLVCEPTFFTTVNTQETLKR